MSKFIIKIGEKVFPIYDLGESMNSQFLRLYENYFSGGIFIFPKFLSTSLNFFDQNDNNLVVQENYFENFTPIWKLLLNQKSFKYAEDLWYLALYIAYQWENKNPNRRIHKGTPYYFWGVTCILNEDLEKGFLLMHQALKEDKETPGVNAHQKPAYSFVTLNHEKQDQYFREKVLEIAKFLDGKLNNYCSSKRGTLNLDSLQSKFLKNVTLQEVAFYFVFELFRLKKLLLDINQRLTQNVFSSLLQANTIFNLCLIVENIIKKQNKYSNKNLNGKTIGPLIDFLSTNFSLNLKKGNNLSNLSDDFRNEFSNTMKELLSSLYHFQDGTSPQAIEEDLAITYGFRNFGAHRIEDQPIIYENFKEITERILYSLFFSIENLY